MTRMLIRYYVISKFFCRFGGVDGEGWGMQVAEQQNGLKQRGDAKKGGRLFTSTIL